MIGPGAFAAVVGASGVGKDSVIAYARTALRTEVVFARRTVTRAPGPGEDHEPVDEATFARMRSAGAFAVVWPAHGLWYGLPAELDDHVRSGRTVLANVSRAVLGDLRERYERCVVIRVSVSDEVRAARLATRGRESVQDMAQRLARVDPAPEHPVDVDIRNDGALSEAGDRLIDVIRQLSGSYLGSRTSF